jgi:RHS repeat-associated protein
LGQVTSTESTAEREVVPGTLTPLWPLADQTFTTGLDVLGRADALTVTTGSTAMQLVTGVSFSPTGQLLKRTYGNEVSRKYTWDEDWGALESVSASFDAGAEVLQSDTYTRDGAGRVISVADGMSDVAQCFAYDGFNRLAWAWTDTRTSTTCEGEWAAATQPAGVQESLGFALNYDYSASGRVNTVRDALKDPDLGDGVEPGAVAAYDYEVLPHAVTSVADGLATDTFTYDDAGRMITRTVDDGNAVTNDLMTLAWDESSNLVATGSATGDRVYVYDASGQRVAQIAVSELTPSATPVSATIYVGDAEGTDADTATTDPDDVSATRFITFGGATVATVTATTATTMWSLLFGDVQGSAQVSMPLVPDALETTGLEPASASHAPTYDAYLPYGAERGDTTDDLAIDRGWLGQYEDSGTGLTYLNARYYDPALGRFLSPDPLMDPGDPRTLDPYRYADNNPVSYTDSSGLSPSCGGMTPTLAEACYKAYGAAQVAKSAGMSLKDAVGKGARSTPARTLAYNLVREVRYLQDLNARSPLEAGLLWAAPDWRSGKPATTAYRDGDRIVESLKRTDRYTGALPALLGRRNAQDGLPVGPVLTREESYYTHTGGAKRAMLGDLPAVLRGQAGGYDNESLAFIGSHSASVTVLRKGEPRYQGSSLNQDVQVRVVASNDTTVASFTRYATGDLAADSTVNNFASGMWKGPFMRAGDPESQTYTFTMNYVLPAA